MNAPHAVSPRPEGGFALAAAVLVLAGIVALAAAGFLLAHSDYRINQSHRASVNAFYVADAGLERYLGSGRIWPDTQQYAHPGGRAAVVARRLVDVDTLSRLFLVESFGTHRPPEGGIGSRTLATVAILRAAPFQVNAAITAPPGLEKEGVSGLVSGFDSANPADCDLSGPRDVAGLAVPPGGLVMSGGGAKGKKGGGTPPGFEGDPPIDDQNPALKLLRDTGIDWASLISGGYAEADYVYSENGYPNFSTDVGSDEWPMIVLDQPAFQVNPGYSGRGTLVATGDLEINGSFSWDGIILVGGQLVSNGNNRVAGAVVTGLNALLGQAVPESHLGNGTWEYRYNSCNVLNALKGIGIPAEEPGTWRERV